MYKYLVTGFVLLSVVMASGQDVSQNPDVDKKAFVQIFWETKALPQIADSITTNILIEAGITHTRYSKIVSSGLKGDAVDLSEAEKAAVTRIQEAHENYISQKRAAVNAICTRHGLTFEKYSTILHTYRSDIAFQQSMQPYFRTYLNEHKQ